MHTVDLREQALDLAQRLGYRIREEWLGGSGGGQCDFAGQRWIFVDLALNAAEQLEQVAAALRSDPAINEFPQPPVLRRLLAARKPA